MDRGSIEDDLADLYDSAPVGHLSTLLDGTVVRINERLLRWLGYRRDEVVGVRRFTDLLSAGSRVYHETHLAPLLHMQGEVGGIAVDLRTADGGRLPVLLASALRPGGDHGPALIRSTLLEARDRRAYEQELLAARRSAEGERERLRHLVADLQRSLLPAELPTPPGLETAAHYRMAAQDEVGGDFYDLFALPGGRWGFFLGDVCGKGAPAAALTSLTRYTLRSAAAHDPDPRQVLATLNSVLVQEHEPTNPKFCTVIAGLLTPPERDEGSTTVALAAGGHPPPLVLRATGTADFVDLVGGQLVGAIDDPFFTAVEVELAPGDALLLHTDGLTEARVDGGRDRYGEDALLAFARALAPTTARDVVAATVSLLEGFGDGLDDDTAVLALGIHR
jgi:sigma-B regulation protein RsbU (phosphoserine phosphatase)